MTVLGITGPTGAGKTTALRTLEAMGVRILDCDDEKLLVQDKKGQKKLVYIHAVSTINL